MKKIIRFLSVFICAVIALTVIASADDQLPVMNAYTTQEGVTLFVESPGAGVEQVYIGNEACQSFTESELGATRTVVLLDNSLSIQEGYRQGIKTFLTDLVAARNDGDTFTIATFSEDVAYLTQDDNDYLAIKEKIDAITFANQKSYFTKALYQVLSDIAESGTIQYTRVIVIADGAENEELGYTDDELYQKIRAVQVPIDTIGCSTGDNAENLKKMFSLSRMSNGKDYLIDNTSLPDILQDIIQEENHLVRIDVTPTQAMSDGTVRSVRVNFAGGAYASAEIAMPFWAAAEPEPETETAPAVEPAAEQTGLLRPGEPLFLALCAAAALVLVAVILVIAAAAKKKKKKKPAEPEPVDLSRIGHSSETALIAPRGAGETEILSGGSSPRTEVMSEKKTVRLCLQDLKDPAKTFEYPIRDRVLIGANASVCQIVIDYDKYVSSVHCEVIAKGDGFVVRDGGGSVLASTNGTYVNDQKATPELPLPPHSVLRLGALKFRVTFQ